MSQRLLLCDDEIHILRATEFKLARGGYDVQCAGDGQEAWDLMQDDVPDLVITDLNMPRMDGLKLIKHMRSDARLADVPVVMLTAKGYEVANEVIREEYRVSKVMTKPFSPRELLAVVQSIVGESASSPAGQPAEADAATTSEAKALATSGEHES